MTDYDELDLESPHARAARLARWRTPLLVLLVAGSAAALVGAGAALAAADLGTGLRARTCSASPLGGLALVLAAGALAGLVPPVVRLRADGAIVTYEWVTIVYTTPAPLLVLVLSMPGLLGCASARRIARTDLVGDALVGVPGIALAVAAAALLGIALARVLHVTWGIPPSAVADDSPSVVELAIAEAEALERDEATSRFHGVDDS